MQYNYLATLIHTYIHTLIHLATLMCVVAGFPEWVIFNAFFTLLAPHLPDRTKLPKLSMVLMFLMKLS